jgi:hypothetical protein
MRKILLLSTFLFVVFSVKAQQVPEFKQKMFVDSLNRLYVNKDEPVYLWLSTTENKDSAVLLQSKESRDYVNPLYLDTEGMNTVRTPSKVNKKTRKIVYPKSDIIFEVYADGIAPISSLQFLGGKKHIKNKKTYYGKGVTLSIKATDKVSGVRNIYYSINGGDFKIYSSKIEFPDEKEIVFKYFAVDNVSNIEKVKTKVFYIDLSPPVIKKSIEGNASLNVLSKHASIVLTSKDELSGVKATYYSIDGKNPVVYTKPLPAYLFNGGDHKLAYFSVDNVGNTTIKDDSEDKEFDFDFVFDNTGPEVELIPLGTCAYKNKEILYLSKDCKVSFDATDDYTAVKKIEYSINSKLKFTTYTDAFTMQEKNQFLYYRAVDELGNYSKLYVQRVIVDDKAPVSWINFGKPQFFDRDTLFINSKTPVTINAKDETTGIKKTEYLINEGSFTEYSSAFHIEQQGLNIVKFKSTDWVENIETVKESNVVVDNGSPKIYVRFSIEKIRTENYEGKELPVYPSYSKMYMAATDQHSGTAKIYYSINGGPLVDYILNNKVSKGGAFTKPGLYTVKIKANDKLGNESIEKIMFYISE